MSTNVKYIPKGLEIDEDGHYHYTEKVGVRLTPGDEVAFLELTQDMTEVCEDEPVTQHIGLSLGQMKTLYGLLGMHLRQAGEFGG